MTEAEAKVGTRVRLVRGCYGHCCGHGGIIVQVIGHSIRVDFYDADESFDMAWWFPKNTKVLKVVKGDSDE